MQIRLLVDAHDVNGSRNGVRKWDWFRRQFPASTLHQLSVLTFPSSTISVRNITESRKGKLHNYVYEWFNSSPLEGRQNKKKRRKKRNIASRDDSAEFPTLYNGSCLRTFRRLAKQCSNKKWPSLSTPHACVTSRSKSTLLAENPEVNVNLVQQTADTFINR